jgi:hypothetical protein
MDKLTEQERVLKSFESSTEGGLRRLTPHSRIGGQAPSVRPKWIAKKWNQADTSAPPNRIAAVSILG